jgi:cell division protein FtsB
MRLPAHLKYIVISILFILAAVNFTRTTLDILKSSRRLDDIRSEVNELEEKKAQLDGDIEYKKSDEYIEERARNDLNLIKPGEKVYVVSDLDLSDIDEKTSDVLAEFTERIERSSSESNSNAYQWYKLFFE